VGYSKRPFFKSGGKRLAMQARIIPQAMVTSRASFHRGYGAGFHDGDVGPWMQRGEWELPIERPIIVCGSGVQVERGCFAVKEYRKTARPSLLLMKKNESCQIRKMCGTRARLSVKSKKDLWEF